MSSTQETEVIIYCKINNFEGLDEASNKEQHEQLETEFKSGVRCRARLTTKEGVDTYTFTYKLKTASDEGFEANKEYTVDIDKDFYEGFKKVAEKRLVKTRYEFASDTIQLLLNQEDDVKVIEVPGIKYEVDIYTGSDGQPYEWCKIDVEVDNILDYLEEHHSDLESIKLNIKISHLPFEPSDSILTLSATEDQKTFIDSLWKDHFNLPPD